VKTGELNKDLLMSAVENISKLLKNAQATDFSDSTQKAGHTTQKDSRSEGQHLVETGGVTLSKVEGDEIFLDIKTPKGLSARAIVSGKKDTPSLVIEITNSEGKITRKVIDPDNPVSFGSQLDFAVESYLKNNAASLIDYGGDDSIPARIVKGLIDLPTALFVGPVGCGKTHNLNLAFDLLCARYGNWIRFDFCGSEGAKDDDLLGTFSPSGNGFTYIYGVLSQAFKAASSGERVFLYIDEINRFSPRTLSIFIQALNLLRRPDFTGFNLFNYHTQEMWSAPTQFDPSDPSKGCIRIVSSINIGDHGTTSLSCALKRRFALMFKIDYMPADQEADLLHAHTSLPLDVCKNMVKVASNIREAFNKMAVASPLDTGSLMDWALLVSKRLLPTPATIMECAELTWLYKCVTYEANGVPSRESLKALQDTVKAVFGSM